MYTTDDLLYYCRCSFEADACVYMYTQQPPSSLSCNPYNSSTPPAEVQLTLACVARQAGDKKSEDTFVLQWFSNHSSKALAHYIYGRSNALSNTSALITSPGQYWCQVVVYNDDGPPHLLRRSNVAEVLPWQSYSSFPMCKGFQSVMENKCADLTPTLFPLSL